MGIILKTCKGCYFINNADSDGLTCAEIGRTGDSLRCILFTTEQDFLLKSDKVLEGVLNDLENYQERVG